MSAKYNFLYAIIFNYKRQGYSYQYIADKLGLAKPTKVEVYENGAVPADANPKEYTSIKLV